MLRNMDWHQLLQLFLEEEIFHFEQPLMACGSTSQTLGISPQFVGAVPCSSVRNVVVLPTSRYIRRHERASNGCEVQLASCSSSNSL